ncbi:hypothetical protein [Brucella pseudogrignonensis]|uniref:hypothetical protein n=1 Tax=Brucella pseudogrignonensis TaxID=419475 RepID=UPI000CFC2D8A|nr:hypothetical protein [Brucella pseudogrignonensis]MQP39179.1 hypothetical protein [Ochrobactrum sp. MYb237]PQZ43766.1 hypothetical protein CQ059_07630 [Brucella pseudogrignonensis]PRA43513.1 hypothetical protein CQ063_04115 [Brucella pseudogrignonensis]PRA72018.1 hypothetical protein CQ055_01460 [Brucella pseudogrignonensis]
MTNNDDSKPVIDGSFSRPFDVNRWADYPELNNCLDELISELAKLDGRTRQRGEKERKHFREAVRCLVLDMYVAWLTDPALLVGVPLSKGRYADESRYRALFLWWSSFKAAYDLLVRAGYIQVVLPGFKDHTTNVGRTTRVKATPALVSFLTEKAALHVCRISARVCERETIILRREKKEVSGKQTPRSVEYQDSDLTNAMRSRLERINCFLQQQWIDIRLSDSEFVHLQARMRRDYEDSDRESPFIDFSQKALVRIFNNNDWQQGGRFYRGWWQSVPKEYRRYITINDKATCEVDYSTLHPNLLYAEKRRRFEGDDAYDIGVSGVSRSLIKKTFNAMLNASGPIKQPKEYSAEQAGMDWKQFQDTIIAKHAPIKDFFNAGYGLRMQRADSDLAEAVMLRFIDMGYACLPVHDSFLVHNALVDELKVIMEEEFQKKTGFTIKTQQIEIAEPEPLRGETAEPLSFNSAFLEPSGEYAGYDKRWLNWDSTRSQ